MKWHQVPVCGRRPRTLSPASAVPCIYLPWQAETPAQCNAKCPNPPNPIRKNDEGTILLPLSLRLCRPHLFSALLPIPESLATRCSNEAGQQSQCNARQESQDRTRCAGRPVTGQLVSLGSLECCQSCRRLHCLLRRLGRSLHLHLNRTTPLLLPFNSES